MSDMRQSGFPDRDPPRGPQPDPLRQASADGRAALEQAKAGASEAADSVRREASGIAEELKAEGAGVLDAARQRAMGFAEAQKQAGAEQAEGFAEAVHGAADQLGEQSPVMARYVHEAASAIEDMGRTLRESSPADLLGRVEDLARRQPVAFFGAAVLAGFGLARFAKSSAEAARSRGHGQSWQGRSGGAPMGGAVSPSAAAQAPGWMPPEAASTQDTGMAGTGAKPATLAAASLGGAAAWPGGSASGLPQRPVAGGGDHV
ncbi:hypothetical protein [Falsiroseomonas tokyonensis]|uniref:Uncharacterized protein n=1 Tax=Falsiroseomonas tokyonensis TaxID=430521 RepID=A0ABV7BUY7_9PROT|nr:hypothetical protein [Falsiroseomonas tokyonensis]MBU8539314.1 hypothetical protein [Falsiroseomonas tokyonensis]